MNYTIDKKGDYLRSLRSILLDATGASRIEDVATTNVEVFPEEKLQIFTVTLYSVEVGIVFIREVDKVFNVHYKKITYASQG